MNNLHKIDGEKGLFMIKPVYIYSTFLTLENKIICLDHNKKMKGVSNMKYIKTIIICKAKDLVEEIKKSYERN